MTDAQLNAFFSIFIESVNAVESEYMRTVYQEMGLVMDMLPQRIRAQIENGELRRTGERIFCYELYHQLRMRIENNDLLPEGIYLQGELRKHQIEALLDRFNLGRLTGDFMPDFVLHTPGNADDHPFIIEVKTDRNLPYSSLIPDLSKIVEFMTRYYYQRGIFLAVNVPFQNLTDLIRGSFVIPEIHRISEVWSDIYIVSRENEFDECHYCFLDEIFAHQ